MVTRIRKRHWLYGGVVGSLTAACAWILQLNAAPPTVGATASLTELSSGVELIARVDTGAAVTSLHCGADDLVIEDPADDPEANVDKRVRLRVANTPGDAAWVETRIESCREVRNAEHAEVRYCVRLPLRLGRVRKSVLVTLNDRSTMSYRLLLGRNYLDGEFLVDVSRPGPGGR